MKREKGEPKAAARHAVVVAATTALALTSNASLDDEREASGHRRIRGSYFMNYNQFP
jgi:hypothetical protein